MLEVELALCIARPPDCRLPALLHELRDELRRVLLVSGDRIIFKPEESLHYEGIFRIAVLHPAIAEEVSKVHIAEMGATGCFQQSLVPPKDTVGWKSQEDVGLHALWTRLEHCLQGRTGQHR